MEEYYVHVAHLGSIAVQLLELRRKKTNGLLIRLGPIQDLTNLKFELKGLCRLLNDQARIIEDQKKEIQNLQAKIFNQKNSK